MFAHHFIHGAEKASYTQRVQKQWKIKENDNDDDDDDDEQLEYCRYDHDSVMSVS